MGSRGMSNTGLVVRSLLAAPLLAGATACVTTEERVFAGAQASPERALESRLHLARGYLAKGNWDAAKRNLGLASDIDPGAPEVHEAFALLYQSTGEHELAERSFRRALERDGDFSRARNNYAAFLYQRQRFREAEAQLEIVVRDALYEARPQAYLNLGMCRARLGDWRGAREALSRALSMERDNSAALVELAHLEYQRGRWRAAQRHYDDYRALVRPQSARGLWLGVRLAHARNDGDAQASYALALRNLYPDSAECRAYRQALEHGEI